MSGRRTAARAPAWAAAFGLVLSLPMSAPAQAPAAPIQPAFALQHSAAADILNVHALMQAGQYRQALGWAAHLAGAHPEQGDGAALYGWLLHRGGQAALAAPLIEAAARRWPENANLGWVQAQIGAAETATDRRSVPSLLAPLATLDEVPADAQVVATASLVDAGHAVAPLAALAGADAAWVRDGLGRTRQVTLERSDAATGLALLRLGSALALDESPRGATGAASDVAPAHKTPEPFAGSVAYAAGYAAGEAAPQWPALTLGFLGRAAAGERPLGFALPGGTGGGPVFDAAGRWIGVTSTGGNGGARFIPRSALHALTGDRPAADAPGLPPPAPAADAVYETAMRVALQLILRQTPWNAAASAP